MQTIHLTGLTADDIAAWAARRIASAQLPASPGPFAIPAALAGEVECSGSWRKVATRLHIWTAQQALDRLKETV